MIEVFKRIKKLFLSDKIYSTKLISAFIIAQPIIDILTFFMKEYFGLNVTLGILIRALFLVYIILYMFFKDEKHKKNNYIYIFSLGIFFVMNIVINYIFKDSYSFSNEIKNIIKIVYFPLTLLFFIRYNQNSDKENKLSIKIFCINALIISGAMILSKLTGTQLCSYGQTLNCAKGSSGWFYSANELGSLLIVLFAVVLYEFYKSNFSFNNMIVIILLIYTILTIGTKASFLGFVLILVATLVFYIVKIVFKRKEHNKRAILMSLVLVLMSYLLIPSMPVCYNNYKLFLNYDIYCKVPVEVTRKPEKEESSNNQTSDNTIVDNSEQNGNDKPNDSKPNVSKPSKDDVEINYENIKNEAEKEYANVDNISKEETEEIVLNGRDDYLRVNSKIFNESSTLRKIFGIGYQNHKYKDTIINHIVERDYHDLLFQYGYLGFVLVLVPLFYLMISVLLSFLRKPKKILEEKNLILISIAICLAGAFISGHTLFAPAVSIYISYLLGVLFVQPKE